MTASPGWTPQLVIADRFPAIARLRQAIEPEIRSTGQRLDRAEACGRDTSYCRQILRELRWRLEYTAEEGATRAALERLRTLVKLASPPSATTPDEEGSYGAGTEVWFLKLDASVDYMLAPDFSDSGRPPRFLDRINHPGRLEDYLSSLLVSRPSDDGIDRRKELNFATAALVRLILWRRPAHYPWHPRLKTVMHDFLARWQDPASGFFGATYLINGCRLRTADLSLTFHMARYLDGKIGYWRELIDTLIEMRNRRYPDGWLDELGMTSHNNYDVAVLFRLGWRHMRPEQQQRAAQELNRLLEWCLTVAIGPDGRVLARAASESLPESYYFTIAFLDAVGYFDSHGLFWTGRVFPEARANRTRLERQLLTLPQPDPMVRMARERLSRSG